MTEIFTQRQVLNDSPQPYSQQPHNRVEREGKFEKQLPQNQQTQNIFQDEDQYYKQIGQKQRSSKKKASLFTKQNDKNRLNNSKQLLIDDQIQEDQIKKKNIKKITIIKSEQKITQDVVLTGHKLNIIMRFSPNLAEIYLRQIKIIELILNQEKKQKRILLESEIVVDFRYKKMKQLLKYINRLFSTFETKHATIDLMVNIQMLINQTKQTQQVFKMLSQFKKIRLTVAGYQDEKPQLLNEDNPIFQMMQLLQQLPLECRQKIISYKFQYLNFYIPQQPSNEANQSYDNFLKCKNILKKNLSFILGTKLNKKIQRLSLISTSLECCLQSNISQYIDYLQIFFSNNRIQDNGILEVIKKTKNIIAKNPPQYLHQSGALYYLKTSAEIQIYENQENRETKLPKISKKILKSLVLRNYSQNPIKIDFIRNENYQTIEKIELMNIIFNPNQLNPKGCNELYLKNCICQIKEGRNQFLELTEKIQNISFQNLQFRNKVGDNEWREYNDNRRLGYWIEIRNEVRSDEQSSNIY